MAVKFSDATREAIKIRSGLRCDLCGARTTGGQIHHRQPRGMGGSKYDDVKGSSANGLYVHPHCHEEIESNRLRAISHGWLVVQADDPRKVPVRLWDGWWLLADDGTMTRASQVDGSAEVDAGAGR
jgi:5-methylcytosine-specific restriction protein A